MGKPRVGILVRRSLREMILPAEALEELERFAEVNLNLEDRDFTEEEAAEFLRDADGSITPLNSTLNTGCTVQFTSTTGTNDFRAVVLIFGR